VLDELADAPGPELAAPADEEEDLVF